jgi:hypothetical protein
MPLTASKTLSVQFPDSGWALQIVVNAGDAEAIVGLYWRGKDYPSHEALVPISDLKGLTDAKE